MKEKVEYAQKKLMFKFLNSNDTLIVLIGLKLCCLIIVSWVNLHAFALVYFGKFTQRIRTMCANVNVRLHVLLLVFIQMQTSK